MHVELIVYRTVHAVLHLVESFGQGLLLSELAEALGVVAIPIHYILKYQRDKTCRWSS